MFLTLPNIKLNNIILTNLKNNISVLSNAIKNIEEFSSSKLSTFEHTDELAIDRHNRFLKECEELEGKINLFNDTLEKMYASIDAKFSFDALKDKMCLDLDEAIEDNKNKYSRLRNEHIGKITILEKEKVITLKEFDDKLADQIKSIKQKYFDLERKTIQEIEAIEEVLLYPVSVSEPLNIEKVLQGEQRTKDFKVDDSSKIRLDGIEKILEKKQNVLCAKKDYLSKTSSLEGNGRIEHDKIILDANVKTLEINKVINNIKKDFEVGLLNIEFERFTRNNNCDLEVEKKRNEAALSLLEKHDGYEKKILHGNLRYTSDREALVDYILKNDTDLVCQIMAFFDRCFYEVSSLDGNIPEGAEAIVFRSINEARPKINEYIKESLKGLNKQYLGVRGKIRFIDNPTYVGFEDRLDSIYSSFISKRDKEEAKLDRYFKKMDKKIDDNPSLIGSIIKEFLEREKNVNLIYQEKMLDLINREAMNAKIVAQKEGNLYFSGLAIKEKKYKEEFEEKNIHFKKELDEKCIVLQNNFNKEKNALEAAILKKDAACKLKDSKLEERIKKLVEKHNKDRNEELNKMNTYNKKLEDETLAKIKMAMLEASRRKKRLE